MTAIRKLPAFASLSALGLLFGALPALAHHSFAMFDAQHEVSISGTVERVEYANPHVWLVVNVPNEQNENVVWELEGGNLMGLYRAGWYQDTVKAGDQVTVRLHPRVDGDPGGAIMTVTQADGTVLENGR